MQIARYKRYSINLDDESRDQCGILADISDCIHVRIDQNAH